MLLKQISKALYWSRT